MSRSLFPALLKYWRGRAGLSQLDLSSAADVSSRHLSYLETGRAKPSEAMVRRLFETMAVPLRHQDEALVAAGFAPRFADPDRGEAPAPVRAAIARMLRQHEPFPMTVLDGGYRLVDRNEAADAIFALMVAQPDRLRSADVDMVAFVFDAALARDAFVEWPLVARRMLNRLQRELLRTGDERVRALLDRALAYPGVDEAWRHPDDGDRLDATLEIHLRRGDVSLGFLTTMTTFTSPGTVSLEEVRLESFFPLDEATRQFCAAL